MNRSRIRTILCIASLATIAGLGACKSADPSATAAENATTQAKLSQIKVEQQAALAAAKTDAEKKAAQDALAAAAAIQAQMDAAAAAAANPSGPPSFVTGAVNSILVGPYAPVGALIVGGLTWFYKERQNKKSQADADQSKKDTESLAAVVSKSAEHPTTGPAVAAIIASAPLTPGADAALRAQGSTV